MFTFRGIEYASARECLRAILRVVRAGITSPETLGVSQAGVREAIRKLKAATSSDTNLLSDAERLRLVTLEAESHQLTGTFDDAVKTLEPEWAKIKPELDNWSKRKPLQPVGDRELRVQKIWISLHYVFFAFHRVRGEQKLAVHYFLLLAEILREDFSTEKRPPHGTRAMCHYSIGICYSVIGATQAETHLLEAQKCTHMRIEREIADPNNSAEDKTYHLRFKDVFLARILSGIARVSIQQGNLVRAEQALYTAQDLLLNILQYRLKLFISSCLWTAARRRASYDDLTYDQAVSGLDACYREYAAMKDPTGAIVCASELARSYIERAEALTGDRSLNISEARYWLKEVPTNAPYRAETVRTRLLQSRLFKLEGKMDLAAEELTKAQIMSEKKLEEECGGEIGLTEAHYFLHPQALNVAKAETAISRVLNKIRSIGSTGAATGHDPLVEAECMLLFAKAEIIKGNIGGARSQLDSWATYRQFIQNYRLHHLASRLEYELDKSAPVFVKKLDIYDQNRKQILKTIPACLVEYEAWIQKQLKSRYGITSKKELSSFYKKDPTRVKWLI